jgi:hypothetical protein
MQYAMRTGEACPDVVRFESRVGSQNGFRGLSQGEQVDYHFTDEESV